MRIRAKSAALTPIAPGALSLLSLIGALALWLAAMAPRLAAQAASGPICSAHGLGLVVHCPGCYAAAALAALSLVLAGVQLARR